MPETQGLGGPVPRRQGTMLTGCAGLETRVQHFHELVDSVGDPLRGPTKLVHRPIRRITLTGPGVVHQPFRQPRQHQLPLRRRDETVPQRPINERAICYICLKTLEKTTP